MSKQTKKAGEPAPAMVNKKIDLSTDVVKALMLIAVSEGFNNFKPWLEHHLNELAAGKKK